MDRNPNSSPQRLPWWVTLIQMSPLILQLASEVILRVQGVPVITEITVHPDREVPIPPPLDAKQESEF